MDLSRYLKVFPSPDRPDHFLLFSTLRGSLAVVPARTLDTIRSGTIPDAEARALSRIGMVVEDPCAEREYLRGLIEESGKNLRHMKVSIVLNLDCNLNCGYCFEENFRGGTYMSRDTADLLVRTLIREKLANGWNLTVTFYGGEPLLSMDLIERISLPLLAAAKRHGVRYDFNLITNGTLLDRATVQRLLPLGLSGAKFTLDGPREIHDGQRPYASGAGSFDAIVDNLSEICDMVPVQLGSNFRQENYREFPRLLDHLRERGITPDKLVQVMFTPVTPKAGCSEYSSGCTFTEEPWLMEALIHLRGETLARGYQVAKLKLSACMVEFEHALVVDCEGRYFKCPALMGYEGMSVGSIGEGMQDYRASHGIGNWQVDECLDCCYLPLCFGGCRFVTKLRGRDLSELDCRRKFFDATLEKTVLQNLAYPAQRLKSEPVRPAECGPEASGAY